MNIIHLIQLFIINVWILSIWHSEKINLLIAQKFNGLILFGCCALYLILTIILFLSIVKKINLYFKFDITAFIFIILIFGSASDYGIEADSLIANKYKGRILTEISNANQFLNAEKNIDLPQKNLSPKNPNINKSKIISEINSKTVVQDTISFLVPDFKISFDENYRELDLLEIYLELNKIKNKNDILNRKYNVETIGQIYPEIKGYDLKLKENEFFLMRFAMVCCAADMIPIAVVIKNKKNFKIKKKCWAKVKGEIHFLLDKQSGGFYGIINDHDIEEIPALQEQYLLPAF